MILGTLVGPPVKIKMKPGAKPAFARAWAIPHALRNSYAQAIDEKSLSGHYIRVDHSE